jgi:sugar phosphate isomerase/epimerase
MEHKISTNMVYFRLFLFFSSFLMAQQATAQKLPLLGMVASLSDDSLLYASGFRLIGTSVSNLLGPNVSEEQFMDNLQKVKAARCKVYMCNVLFPGNLKIAGPEVEEGKVLEHLTFILGRAKKAGIKKLVLGSGGARKLPEGYDKEKAMTDFIRLGRKMAVAARQHGVTIILESLNSTETNFINTLKEAAAIVRGVDHRAFRLNVDIYHMMKEVESPQEIIKAKDLIVYCEIAERDKRTLPGVTGDDFRPYLKALRQIRYQGPIIVEGKVSDLATEAPKAHAYLLAQLKEAY